MVARETPFITTSKSPNPASRASNLKLFGCPAIPDTSPK